MASAPSSLRRASRWQSGRALRVLGPAPVPGAGGDLLRGAEQGRCSPYPDRGRGKAAANMPPSLWRIGPDRGSRPRTWTGSGARCSSRSMAATPGPGSQGAWSRPTQSRRWPTPWRRCASGSEVLVQGYVAGRGVGAFFLIWDGRFWPSSSIGDSTKCPTPGATRHSARATHTRPSATTRWPRSTP